MLYLHSRILAGRLTCPFCSWRPCITSCRISAGLCKSGSNRSNPSSCKGWVLASVLQLTSIIDDQKTQRIYIIFSKPSLTHSNVLHYLIATIGDGVIVSYQDGATFIYYSYIIYIYITYIIHIYNTSKQINPWIIGFSLHQRLSCRALHSSSSEAPRFDGIPLLWARWPRWRWRNRGEDEFPKETRSFKLKVCGIYVFCGHDVCCIYILSSHIIIFIYHDLTLDYISISLVLSAATDPS